MGVAGARGVSLLKANAMPPAPAIAEPAMSPTRGLSPSWVSQWLTPPWCEQAPLPIAPEREPSAQSAPYRGPGVVAIMQLPTVATKPPPSTSSCPLTLHRVRGVIGATTSQNSTCDSRDAKR